MRDSIRDRGLLTPLLVRPVGGSYEVVDGANRFEALCDLKWRIVPCNVMELTDSEVLEVQIEAHGHIPTQPVEYARRLWRIINVDKSLSIQEVAYGIHRTPDWVKKTLNLVYLSPLFAEEIDGGRLPLNCAVELAKLPLPSQEELQELYGKISNKELRLLAQDEARSLTQGKKDARMESKIIDRIALRGYLRDMREIENELETPTVAASIINQEHAESAIEIWCACLKWVLRRDTASLAYLRSKLS